jgi:hypothetical protein
MAVRLYRRNCFSSPANFSLASSKALAIPQAEAVRAAKAPLGEKPGDFRRAVESGHGKPFHDFKLLAVRLSFVE